MRSKILLGAGNYLLPVLMLFSVFLLFRGHNSPGGGFVGGLTAASGIAFYIITHGRKPVINVLPLSSPTITIIGATFLLIAGVAGFFSDGYFLESISFGPEFPIIGKPDTAFLFDIGVYFVVIGSVTKIVLTLTSE
jgi:multicomponent Na+:H+ antiporter subunit B